MVNGKKHSVIFNKRIYFFLCCLFVLHACKEEVNPVLKEESVPFTDVEKIVFTPLFFIDNSFQNISFPNWWNNELIKKEGVSSLRIKETVFNKSKADSIPVSAVHDFIFNKDGELKEFSKTAYHRGKKISNYVFAYRNKLDAYGYSLPTFNLSKSEQVYKNKYSLLEIVGSLSDHNRYIKSEYKDSILLYENTLDVAGNWLTYLLDSSSWNVFKADELTKKDGYICYGNPTKPIECFKLENLVTKTKWTTIDYVDEKDVLQKITTRKNYSFTERNVLFDSLGRVDYYIDNTYKLDSTLIEVNKKTIIYAENHLPLKIKIEHGADTAFLKMKGEKEFEYKFLNRE